MKRALLFILIGVLAALGIVMTISSSKKSSARKALLNYKAKLKAQGEKLTFAEWGYPRTAESNDCLPRLVQAVKKIEQRSFYPGLIQLLDVSSATNVQPCWTKTELNLTDGTTWSWELLQDEIEANAPYLAEIRDALAHPPKFTTTDPTNFVQGPAFHFVEQRSAAQWLSADLVHALRQNDLARARDDLGALQQMVHLQEEDVMLVAQMIRVAIASLALHGNWEALQADGWAATDLKTMQEAWERINLIPNLEWGILGERLVADAVFTQLDTMNSRAVAQYMTTMFGGTPRKDLRYYWESYVTTPVWRMNREADELLTLRHHQKNLDAIRSLNHGTNWTVVRQKLETNSATLRNTFDSPLTSIRYSMSAALIPNLTRTTLTTVRAETMRRLTVTAIALKRYELRHGSAPATLEALVPDFISAVPTDPMSGGPMRYRVTESGWILYSVGEDGVDNNGDASLADPVTPAKDRGIWSGRDFVWPNPPKSRP
jgi:hypothetical protein